MNEVTITSKIVASKGGVEVTQATSTKHLNMSTTSDDMDDGTQNVSTSREALDVGDVDITNATGDEYLVRLANLSPSYNCKVEINHGSSAYYQVGLMRPGEFWGPVRMQKLDASGYGGLFLTFITTDGRVRRTVVEAGDPDA